MSLKNRYLKHCLWSTQGKSVGHVVSVLHAVPQHTMFTSQTALVLCTLELVAFVFSFAKDT